MLVQEKENNGLQRVFAVTVSGKDFNTRIDAQLEAIKGRVQLNGFRPGKAPLSFLRKMYGRSVLSDVLEQVSQDAVNELFEKQKLRFATTPKADLPGGEAELEAAYEGKGDLTMTLSCELLPNIELKDLSKYSFERLTAEVADEDVQKAAQSYADGHKHYHDKGDKKAANGDRVTCDFEGKLDGVPFEGGTAQDATVDLGSGRYLPDFEAGIVGMKAGEVKTFDVAFPESYMAKELAGKITQFTITAKKVEEGKGHAVDEAFAVHMGYESLEDMNKNIRDMLQQEFNGAARVKLKRAILDKMADDYDFDVPASLVNQEFEVIWRNLTVDMARHGLSFQDEGKTEDEAQVEYRAIAERRVRLGLVLAELGDVNKVQVTDREVEMALMMRARQFPGQEQAVVNYYRKNPEALAELRAPVFEEKVIDHIIAQAKITDKTVSREVLFAEDDAEEAPKAAKKSAKKADAAEKAENPAKAKKAKAD